MRAAEGPPRWEGRAGRLAYLAKMFPRISETFILDEVLQLRRAGVPLRIYSLLPPTRDFRIHPAAEELTPDVEVLPQPGWRTLGGFLRDLLRCLGHRPGATLRQVGACLVWPTPRARRRLFRAVTLAVRLRRDEIAHLHAAWAHTPASVAMQAARLVGVPWSLGAHAKDIHLTAPRSLAERLAEARFAVACTRTNRDLLLAIASRHGRSPDPPRVELLHHGVDVEFFAPDAAGSSEAGGPAGQEEGPVPRILTVGRLVPKKGFDVLLEAAAALHRRGVPFSLEIVGEGPLRSDIAARIRTLGLESCATLRGMLVREEVRDAYRAADCFVLPSRVAPDGDRDGIPNTLAEAMACGLAVVSTRLPAIEELVTHGETGLLVPPEDTPALADALSCLLADPEERRRLGRAARVCVSRMFDASRLAPRRAAVFADVLGVRRALYLCGDRGVPVRGSKGASIHVRSLLQAWERLGVQTMVVSANAGPAAGPAPAGDLIEARAGEGAARLARFLARVPGGGLPLERQVLRLLDNAVLYRESLRRARGWHPDLLYERYTLLSFAGGLVARRLGIPHVLEVNAPLALEEERYRGLRFRRLTRWFEGWILRRADLVVVVSPALVRHARTLRVKPERIVCLPNAIDPELFHPARQGAPIREALGLGDRFVVGFAGTLKPWHGVKRLLRAAGVEGESLAQAHFLILGDGPERRRLERQAEKAGLADRVHFVGAVPHQEVGAYLAACDVLAAPFEKVDDFYFSPLKIWEYLAVGRPVVASDVGEVAEHLGEGTGVVRVRPGNEEELAAALVKLMGCPDWRLRLGRAAAAARVWTWEDVARAALSRVERIRRQGWGWAGSRPLAVGYVLKMFPRLSETFILNEILELERLGHRVVVFSMKSPGERRRQPAVERVSAPVLVLPPPGGRGLFLHAACHLACLGRRPVRYLRTLAYARSRRSESAWKKFAVAPFLVCAARRHGVEHFHAHFASGPARQAKFAALLSGKPFSFTAHAKDLYWSGHHHETSHRLKKRVRLAAFVVTISESNRLFIENLGFHVPHRRLVTVYNGLDLHRWRWTREEGRPRVGDPDDPPLLLAVGRLVEKKGFHVLIESCRLLAEAGVSFHCVIVGEGPERDRLEALLRERSLEDRVQLAGALTQDRLVADYYLRARLLVQPSVVAADGDQDGIPTVILEALALGLPVVATPVSGIGEAVLDDETGLLVPPADPRRLAAALRRLVEEEGLAARLAAGGRRLVERRFDLRQNAKILVHLMENSARGARRWSVAKLRWRMGLEDTPSEPGAEESEGVDAEVGDAARTHSLTAHAPASPGGPR